jgi:hypothetical protein
MLLMTNEAASADRHLHQHYQQQQQQQQQLFMSSTSSSDTWQATADFVRSR